MTVGKAIYYLLTNSTDVTDIVSTRVYPEIAEQNAALPYVVYNISNNEPTDTKPEPSKLDTAQIEVNVYSESYTECIDLAVAVRAALDRVKGTYNGVNVQSIQYLNEIIDFDEPQRAYNIAADYDVRISRTDFEIAQGSPITGVELGELSDVNVTGVTDNQVLSYDAATDTWVPAIDAGGASELSDLSDVSISLPSDGEVLIYSGGEFVNDNIAISNVTGLQAALDAAPNNLRELTDVTITTPTTGDYLYYNGTNWINQSLIVGRDGVEYTGNYDTEAETLLDGATATVELYYTAQADGDGLHEDAQTDTATTGYDIRRKLYYAEKAQADPDTSGDWTQFTAIADNTTFADAKAALLAYLKERTGGTVPISLKMTWEEVAEATLLLDTYTGAAAAYSLRQLRTGETEAVRVRRSSDNTEQTIGFSAGELDTTALATFCGSSDGFVKTWMDQSGNGNDATQTTAANQPKIYDGTTGVTTDGTKPTIEFASTGNSNLIFTRISDIQTIFTVRSSFSSSSGAWFMGDSVNNNYRDGSGILLHTGALAAVVNGSNYINGSVTNYTTTAKPTTQSLFTMIHSSASASSNYLTQDRSQTARSWAGPFSELIIYNTDKSADRTNIEDNINTFYDIY